MALSSFRARVALSLLPLILLSGSALADAPYAGPRWAPLDMKAALVAAREITPEKYPDSDDATVEEHYIDDYQPDGTALNQDEAFVKVLTEKGRRDRRTVALGFQLPYNHVNVVKLEVIRPGGEILPVDIAANSTETIDDSQMAENIYDPNTKVLLVNIPDLEVGDVVHSITRNIIDRSIIPGEFADENLFENGGYIRHMLYEVYAPVAKPLAKIVLKDEIPGTVRYSKADAGASTVVHRWEVANVPRMFDEPGMPPPENALQRLLVSTTPTWQDVSKWYWVLSKPHLDAISPELKQTVADLTRDAKTDTEKMKALFYYVSQKVRYMGITPEKDRPGYEPHDVCMTLAKQYGVCRDKAALLVAMLRTAGVHAYPVLVNVGSRKDAEVPDANFNHAIVGVEMSPGHYQLLDPTDQHARDFQPWYDGDQSFLVCRPEGEVIGASPFAPPSDNLMRIRTSGTLSAAGRLDAAAELTFTGANDDIYRNHFSGLKKDDLRRFFDERLKKAVPGARLKSLTVLPEDMLDVSRPIQAIIEFSVEDLVATGHGRSVVSVPWIGKEFGLLNRVLESTGLDKRKYALRTRIACGLDEKISIKLGPEFAGAESLPECPRVDNDAIGYTQAFSQKDGVLECARRFDLKAVELAPAQYAELKRTLKELGYDARKSPVLAVREQTGNSPAVAEDAAGSAPISSNSVVLDSQKELDVTSPHTADYHVKFTRRILTYAGKIKEAEIKVAFNPACEDVHFIRGVVTSKDGTKQEAAAAEINVMDSDSAASARRYTGGKVLVASLPGVDVGSTLDVEFEIKMKDMPFIGGFEPFQLPDDLDQKSFTIKAPAGLPVATLVTGTAAIKTGSAGSGDASQVMTWSGEKVSALPAEDQAPPDWVFKPGVAYFAGDFNAYLQELSDVMEDRSHSSTKAASIARSLAQKAGSKIEAVHAIRDYVARSIRLAGPPFTHLPLSELSAADTTLEDGYGHGADRAILLHAMLAAAGFEPRFVLAANLPAAPEIESASRSIALAESFDMPLVKIVADGQTIYLNDTDQYARLGSTSHDGHIGVDLASKLRVVIAAAKECGDRTDTDYKLSLAANGKLRMDVMKRYYGQDYNEKSRFYAELRPEELKRYHQEIVSKVDQGARAVGDLEQHFDSYPGTEKFAIELDKYAVVDGRYLYFDLPFTPSMLELPGGEHRALPFLQDRRESALVRAEISLPDGYKDILIAPHTGSFAAPGGSRLRLTSATDAGHYVLTQESDTTPAVISARDFTAVVKVESQIERKSGQVFLLRKD